jgi:hypothetical protein
MVVNLVNKGRCQHYRFGTARRIKTLIAASKPQDFHHSVGVVEREEKRANHVVQAWTQAAAGYDAGACPGGLEKQLRARPGKLKQDLIPPRCSRITYDNGRNSRLVTD